MDTIPISHPAPALPRVALAGNPNSGKTTLFNALTGSRQRVGNYPGVTVERKEGHLHLGAQVAICTDLPGTYGLSGDSPDEAVARAFLLEERGAVVVDVLDAGNLERNLYLTLELVELEVNLVLALNMADDLERSGRQLDLGRLSELLGGVPVVLTEGSRGKGMEALRGAIRQALDRPVRPRAGSLGPDLEEAVTRILDHTGAHPVHNLAPRALAIRLLEEDAEVTGWVRAEHPDAPRLLDHVAEERARIHRVVGTDAGQLICERRYGLVAGLLEAITLRPPLRDRIDWTGSIDRILAHRVLGLPIFLAAMYALFWLTFTAAEAPVGWIEGGFDLLARGATAVLGSPETSLAASLVVDGVIGGVGGVLVFLPNIVLLFLGISFLEDTGYMARAAVLVDRVMHRIGLHGKSFIPMAIGFGCTVPAVMACRTLGSPRDRLATMLVLPLMSCGARLPIYLLLVPAFFPPAWRAPVLMGVYLTGVVAAGFLAWILRRTLLAGASAPFVLELPPYRLPTLRGMLLHIWQRAWMYLRKAGTVILAISLVMWAASTFPVKQVYDVDLQVAAGEVTLDAAAVEQARALERLEHTVAGRVGHAMEPLIRPMGFDWRIGTALLGAFAAKEVVVAQLGIVFSLEEGDADLGACADGADCDGLQAALAARYPPRVGLGLILFCLVASPCMGTVAIMARESGRWRWAALQWGGLTALAWLGVTLLNQGARLLGF